jgi:hypothetical protein
LASGACVVTSTVRRGTPAKCASLENAGENVQMPTPVGPGGNVSAVPLLVASST